MIKVISNMSSESMQSSMSIAIANRDTQTVVMLLKKHQADQNNEAFIYALNFYDISVLQCLLKIHSDTFAEIHGQNVSMAFEKFLGSYRKNFKCVIIFKILVDNDFHVKLDLQLYWASVALDYSMVSHLICGTACADRVFIKYTVPTALMAAVIGDRNDIATLLLHHGAKDVINQSYGKLSLTPLMVACKHGALDVVETLVLNGASNIIKDANGWTALHHAVFNNKLDCVDRLLNVGHDFAGVDLRNDDGETPLFFAARQKNVKIAQLLIDAGANKAIRNNANQTAFDFFVKETKHVFDMKRLLSCE